MKNKDKAMKEMDNAGFSEDSDKATRECINAQTYAILEVADQIKQLRKDLKEVMED